MNGFTSAWRALLDPGITELELGAPWMLLALLPIVGAVLAVALGPAPPTLKLARGEAAARLPRGAGVVLRVVSIALGFLALLLAALTLAQPQILGEPDPSTTEGIDLVVALDVSGSMRAADFRPQDRLHVAKKVIEERVFTRKHDRVGLVIFAGEAFTQAPLTHDKGLLKQILDGVRVGVIKDGTAIGDGLATSLNRLKESKAKTRGVILLSDGDNNSGIIAPESATDLAVELGVKVYTILVGKGGRVPFPDGTDIFGAPRYVTVEMPVNPALLKTIATRTGASFFLATDPKSLETSFQQILDSLERSRLENAPPVRKKIPLAPLLLLPAAIALLFSLALAFTRASTVP